MPRSADSSVESQVMVLRDVLQASKRRVLVVVDDVWEPEEIGSFDFTGEVG